MAKNQTEHHGLLKMKMAGCEKHEFTPLSKTRQTDKCTVTQMTVGVTPPIPSATKMRLLEL